MEKFGNVRRLAIWSLIYAFVFTFASCGREFYKNSGVAWGTAYNITYAGNCDLHDSVTAVMRRVELSLSMFDESSVVSMVNRGETTVVDSMFSDVLSCSRWVNSISGGVFDPTVAPLVDLWGFGRQGTTNTPDSAAVARALERVGISRCSVANGKVVAPEDTEFDFSAVAKGYGVDCVAAMLQRNGCEDYMVEIGGEIAVAGRNPQGQPWRIQIDAPVVSDRLTHQRLTVIELTAGGMATSGNYRNYRELADGRRVGHTISPLTGYPAVTTTLSATVRAADCMTADALATACMAMPQSQALEMIESLDGVEALLVVGDDGGEYKLVSSSGW